MAGSLGVCYGISFLVLFKWLIIKPLDSMFGLDGQTQLAFIAGVGLIAGVVLGRDWVGKMLVAAYLATAAATQAYVVACILQNQTRVHTVMMVGIIVTSMVVWISGAAIVSKLGAAMGAEDNDNP